MNENLSYILVTVSGPDRPGITSNLMKVLKDNQIEIYDIGQAVTHGLLSLSFMVGTKSEKKENSGFLKDLLFEAKAMGLNLDFQLVEKNSRNSAELEKFVLTCVSTEFIHDISTLLSENRINIHRIDNVSSENFNTLEIATTTNKNEIIGDKFKKELMKLGQMHLVDLAFLKDDIFRRSKRLIVFDMDSTLIQMEVIDELAIAYNVGDKVKKITERAMNGEIDFNHSLMERVGLLKGLNSDVLQGILERLLLTPGTEDFIKTVKKLGYKTAIVSGGFTYFANALKEKLGIDYAFANELDIQDKILTGKVKGTIINAEQKALLVDLIAQKEGISLEQVVAIGDGANDLPMLAKAGMGIAFHAKEVVKQKASYHLSHGPMTSILYFLGIPGTHLK